tara:strand:+ start:294 stop:1241 length:948 start_codon:yes stop_codon:yes gene_type:complete
LSIDSKKLYGVVVALKANYLFVDLEINHLFYDNYKQLKDSNLLRVLCTRRSRLNHVGLTVNVGDKVLVESIDLDQRRGVISSVEPRKSFIKRPPIANFTDVFVVISLAEPEFNPNQVSRFLLAAEQTKQNVDLILTKKDLVDEHISNELIALITGWGYKPIVLSIKNGEGIDYLINQLKSKQLSVLCGPSGVGKSSLINFLKPELSLSIGELSKKLKRGRHITRHVELFKIGSDSFIADSPGFNRPDLNINPYEFEFLFPEFRSSLSTRNCKFRNCLHLYEPGCVLDKNLNRYSEYKAYLEEQLILLRQYQADLN